LHNNQSIWLAFCATGWTEQKSLPAELPYLVFRRLQCGNDSVDVVGVKVSIKPRLPLKMNPGLPLSVAGD